MKHAIGTLAMRLDVSGSIDAFTHASQLTKRFLTNCVSLFVFQHFVSSVNHGDIQSFQLFSINRKQNKKKRFFSITQYRNYYTKKNLHQFGLGRFFGFGILFVLFRFAIGFGTVFLCTNWYYFSHIINIWILFYEICIVYCNRNGIDHIC